MISGSVIGPQAARVLCAAGLIVLGVAHGVAAWQVRIAGGDSVPAAWAGALAVAVRTDGDVIVAGALATTPAPSLPDFYQLRPVVVRLDGVSGTERWRWQPSPGARSDYASAVTVDAAGDAIVATTSGVAGAEGPNVVIGSTVVLWKLAGDTGEPIWSAPLAGPSSVAANLAVDGAQDVVLAGAGGDDPGATRFAIFKVSGATGDELWRRIDDSSPPGLAERVWVDPAGDIVAGGTIPAAGGRLPATSGVVTKFDGTGGTTLWSFTSGQDIAIAGTEDVFGISTSANLSGGCTDHVRLASATGAVVWESGGCTGAGASGPIDIASAPGGDVFTLGPRDTAGGLGTVVSSLDASSGARRWERPAPVAFGGTARLAVLADGDVVVAGALAGAPFATLRLAALDGAEKWRRVGSGPTPGELRVADLRVSGNRIIVGGAARPPGTNQPFEFTVLGIDAKTGAFGVCGDGNVEGDEACDETSPCCTSSCQPAAGNGTTCRLADGCTAPGRCRAGRCSGGKRLPYAPCGACDPFRGSDAAYEPCGGCYGGTTFVPTLRSCREPIESRAAALVLAKTPRALHWRWRRGAATTSEELGDPLGGTGYALCAYATGVDGQPQSLLAFATAPGGAGWSRTPSGFRYRVGRPNGTGLRTLSLRSGQAGRAKIALDASGEDLLIPNLPLDAGIEVNLVRTDGSDVCWGVQHDFVRRNRARRFAATGPELP